MVDAGEARPVEVSDRTVEACGTTVHYHEAGAEHRGKAPAIVFVHGLGSGSGSWVANLAALGAEYWCVAPDLVGFAETPPPEDFEGYTPAAAVGYLHQVLDTLGVGKAVIVGWSLGGAVALYSVLSKPGRYAGLVLVSAAGIDRHIHWGFRFAALPRIGEWMVARLARRVGDYAEKFLSGRGVNMTGEFLDYHARLWENPWHAEATLRVLRDNRVTLSGQSGTMLRERLHEINLPTLIIWGEKDPLIPLSHGRLAAELIPNAELSVYEGCGHMAPLEDTERFNRDMFEFMHRIARR